MKKKKKVNKDFYFSKKLKNKSGKKVQYSGMTKGEIKHLEKLSKSISPEKLRENAAKVTDSVLNEPLENFTKDFDSLVEENENESIPVGPKPIPRKSRKLRIG